MQAPGRRAGQVPVWPRLAAVAGSKWHVIGELASSHRDSNTFGPVMTSVRQPRDI